MLDFVAVDARHDAAVMVGRKLTDGGMLSLTDLDKLFACASDVIDVMVYAVEMELRIKTIEDRNSMLCNCNQDDRPPSTNGFRIDHHCGCSAVQAAAALLGSYKLTKHASQCSCWEIYDKTNGGS